MAPRLITQAKFHEMAAKLLDLGEGTLRVGFPWLQSFIGIYGHMCKFLFGGNALRNSGNMLLRRQPSVRKDIRLIKSAGTFLDDVREVMRRLRAEHFLPLVRNPRAIHGGRLTCAADACMEGDGHQGGWGFIVGNRYAYGLWSEEVREAFRSRQISISPLEYLVELFAHKMWVTEMMKDEHVADELRGGWTISRSDNMASCMVSKRQLTRSPTMAYFARTQSRMEADLGVYIAFDHIPGVSNGIPDKLSRGAIREALAEMDENGIAAPTRIYLGAPRPLRRSG